MSKAKKARQEPGAPLWMVTFLDLVTLLLVFFIIMFSFSTTDIIMFETLVASIQGAGVLWRGENPLEPPPEPHTSGWMQGQINDDEGDPEQEPDPTDPVITQEELQELMDMLELAEDSPLVEMFLNVLQYIADHELENVVEARLEQRGIALEIQDRVLFDTASSVLRPDAREVLARIAPLLRDMPYMLSVEGHTDNRPISTIRYPNNWVLSMFRAYNVAMYFIDNQEIEPERIAIVALGEYQPAVENTPETWHLNRRVIIVINAENPFSDVAFDFDELYETLYGYEDLYENFYESEALDDGGAGTEEE